VIADFAVSYRDREQIKHGSPEAADRGSKRGAHSRKPEARAM
jgi:hypothetical protein